MTGLPVLDFTPNTDQRWAQDVISAALHITRRYAPANIVAAIDARRAYCVSVFGRDNLIRLDVIMAQHAGLADLLWQRSWQHPGAGRVETLIYLVPEGRSAEDLTAQLRGGGQG